MGREDDGEAATLPPEPTVRRDGRPARMDRYELGALLGQGGMGTVYEAHDRLLGRTVAVKVLRGGDPELALRFLQEARAQSRIDHPGVCGVYEVGEVDGKPYLAMRRIHGEPLHVAGARMPLRAQLAVMRDAAEALHAAHALGIVHRDIKPGNILVERGDDGWHPVVMDFGLARDLSVAAGLTATGALLGTPAYMAPEQARGGACDVRSDVYSLGATLYELVTGQPPFAHGALADTLARVLHEEPVAPRRLRPELPADVETIALQCLAKDPQRRYASAQLLADDLARCLAGEPIAGRKERAWRKVVRRARRQRGLVAVIAGALVLVAIVVAIGVTAWRGARGTAAEQAQLAARLASETTELELWLRSAYQRPLHDTRPDRTRVHEQMRQMRALRHTRGAAGDAAIHEALGRAALALHDWSTAADELRAAGASPALHAARGRALGELYHRALAAARRSGDAAWLAAQRQALAARYLAPALIELALARAAGDDGELVAARMALYRGDAVAAERTAAALAGRAPWLDEALGLAGEAAATLGGEALDRGDYAGALTALARARRHYAAAAEVARSDGSVHEAAARCALLRAEAEYRRGEAPRAALDDALAAIDRALTADPDDATAHTTKAYVLLRWFRTPAIRGEAVPLLERIAEAAGRAVALDPGDARAWDALGNAHIFRGVFEAQRGGDDAAWFERALAALRKAVAADPDDPWAHNDLGAVHRWRGEHLAQTGGDPRPEYAAALASYARAAVLDPHYVFAWSNQADIHVATAEYEVARGGDPAPRLASAVAAGQRALALDPSYYSLLDTLAQAELLAAQSALDQGADPSAALARARGYLDRADRIQRDNMVTAYYRGQAAALGARHCLRAGCDAAPRIAEARAALQDAQRLAPAAAVVYVELARLGLLEASLRRDPRLLARAADAAAQAIARNPRSAEAELVAAEVALARRDRRGLAHVARAQQLHPGMPRVDAVGAALAKL